MSTKGKTWKEKSTIRRAQAVREMGLPAVADELLVRSKRLPRPLRRFSNPGFLDQLENCSCDAARRLLLGVSR